MYGIRGIYFAVMEEARIPLISTGAAVGIISIIGFTPDVFMGPLMGFLLDKYPGAPGHQYVFLVLSLFLSINKTPSLLFTLMLNLKK